MVWFVGFDDAPDGAFGVQLGHGEVVCFGNGAD